MADSFEEIKARLSRRPPGPGWQNLLI